MHALVEDIKVTRDLSKVNDHNGADQRIKDGYSLKILTKMAEKLYPPIAHNWKKAPTAQTLLCYFSGLLCYFFACGHVHCCFFAFCSEN